jgi:Zn finger protein HypA/HybF involved in hydrogenase expression
MKKYNWNIEDIKVFVKDSVTFSEVLRKLNIPIQGNNSVTLRKLLDENNIDYSHFTGRARFYSTNYVESKEYTEGRKEIRTFKLKEKLLKEHLIEYKCDVCGISTWQNKHIVLQLHHIDGNNTNNSIDNLQLLCPNCHSQTENYCGNANTNTTKYYCKECGRKISNKRFNYCPVCAAKHKRKLDRPELNQLISDIKELKSYAKVGEKYNVSDNSVKKWFISYGLPKHIKELKEHINNIQ